MWDGPGCIGQPTTAQMVRLGLALGANKSALCLNRPQVFLVNCPFERRSHSILPFYLYELCAAPAQSLADAIIRSVASVCPILQATKADGWPARQGIVRPNVDPLLRPDWPEALHLYQEKTDLCYTFEAPSDYELSVRVGALVAAATAGIERIAGEDG